ncbi:hypothetical protein ACFLVS_05645 [Chloroflexota bacterium]
MGVLSIAVTFLIVLGLVGAGVLGLLAPSPLPEPSPRWSLIIAYPAILLMFLFFVAGLRLQFRLYDLEQFTKLKSGDIVKNKVINVSALFDKRDRYILDNITFSKCTLKGPCLVAVRWKTDLIRCGFWGGELSEHLILADENRRYNGIGVFVKYRGVGR